MKLRAVATAVMLVALISGSGCALKNEADAQFGDQNFKTAIALIELYKARYGHYPESLGSLTYTGKWDEIS